LHPNGNKLEGLGKRGRKGERKHPSRNRGYGTPIQTPSREESLEREKNTCIGVT